jgi:predicted O-methyltransferase YrrM
MTQRRPAFGSGIPWLVRRAAARLLAYLDPVERRFMSVRGRIDAVEGLLAPGQERWLFRTAHALRDGAVIVEIGAYKGRSTTALAFACEGTRKRIYSVDTFDGNESDFSGPGRRAFFETWQNNLKRNGLDDYATPIVGDSRQVGKGWDRHIDMLFIDASHAYEDVRADFENFFPWVVSGGIFALHDVFSHEGPTRVWTESKHLLRAHGQLGNLAYGRKV